MLEYEAGSPKVTKDGVTIAKSIYLSSREEELGCKLVKSGSGTTNVFAGDGTSSSVVLTRELVRQGVKALEYGMHPIDLKIGMNAAAQALSDELSKMVKHIYPCKSDLFHVAMVSTNYDEKLSDIISSGLAELGKDGDFVMDESSTNESYMQILHGAIIDRGFVTSQFVNNDMNNSYSHYNSYRADLRRPYVMVVGTKVLKAKYVMPIVELVKKTGRPLLIFSAELGEEALSNLVYNNKKGLLSCCAVNVPWQGGEEVEFLKDIAVLTGATFIDNNMINSITNAKLDSLGGCASASITAERTQLTGAYGSKKQIEQRIAQLKNYLESHKEVSLTWRKIVQNRISRLNGLVGILYVGAQTESIRNETHDKIIDALNACKSAMEKGILPGGGSALVHAAKAVEDKLTLKNIDQRQGARIVLNSAATPLRIILRNAGLNDSIILNKIREAEDVWTGYDVKESKGFI